MDAAPLDAAEFGALMARFAPFERAPRLALGVSGGADSLALALLADRWARGQGGSAVALTVDHRLRPQSAAEADQVAAWLARRGIAHRVLVWHGPRPRRGVQASARAARYRLLEDWCAGEGVLHLLLAHHREDQAETVLLRLTRGSGLAGLAGMAGLVELGACRVLRPLLSVPRARLKAVLEAAAQPWIEDPSNRDRAYARVRLRQLAATLAQEGLRPERLAATARHLGRARAAIEAEVAALLAQAAALHPAGFLRLDRAALLAAPAELALRALAAGLTAIGGGLYPPRLERLERLFDAIAAGLGEGRTLGGCRVLPGAEGGLLICREPAAMAAPVPAAPGVATRWDGRFRLDLAPGAPAGLSLGALGGAPLPFKPGLPRAAWAGLAALWRGGELVAVPALGHAPAPGARRWLAASRLVFRPIRPLCGAGFTVV